MREDSGRGPEYEGTYPTRLFSLNPRTLVANQIHVGLLGATGTVGRQLVQQLRGHPWFRLKEVAGSPASAGLSFGQVVSGDSEDPEARFGRDALSLRLKEPDDDWTAPVLLSALPSSVAGALEVDLAGRGHVVEE